MNLVMKCINSDQDLEVEGSELTNDKSKFRMNKKRYLKFNDKFRDAMYKFGCTNLVIYIQGFW